MILAGVICVALSIFMLIIDRKRAIELYDNMDIKKEDIIDALNDAEQIVVEMNNFSDYLFEKIDSKAKEIEDILKNSHINAIKQSEEVLEAISINKKNEENEEKIEKIEEIEQIEQMSNLNVVNGTCLNYYAKPAVKTTLQNWKNPAIDISVNETQININEVLSYGSDKVIPINPKHKNVYLLFEKGYSEIEIAKMLKLGLGEIKLILGVKR
jgi:hypothetical protein